MSFSPPSIIVLLALVALAPLSRAQRDYSPSLRFSVLGVSGHTYTIVDSVATDVSGNLYVGETFNGIVRKYSPDGTSTTLNAFFLGIDGERVPATFHYPVGLAADASGNVYVVSTRSVDKIAPDGMTTTLADYLNAPRGIAVDASGNLYVAESENHVIRKFSPDGTMSTFAGTVGEKGSADGTESARFFRPSGVAVDSSGTVFVADCGNCTIRKIAPDGVVSTLAGSAARQGALDGIGAAARFDTPYGITVDSFGTVYVTEGNSNFYAIRKVTPAGVVTTLTVEGGFGGLIEAGFLSGVAVDHKGIIYAMDGWYGALLISGTPPGFTAPLASQSVAPGSAVTFRATGEGATPIDYQWLKDGAAIPDATNATLALDNVQAADLGSYSVRLKNSVGTVTGNPAALSFLREGRNGLANLSLRGRVGTGGDTLIANLTIGGTAARTLLIRAVGPALATLGVPGTLADPKLDLFKGAALIETNDNWGGTAAVASASDRIGAFPLDRTSRDAALLVTLPPGSYAAHVSGVANTTGVALIEIYEVP